MVASYSQAKLQIDDFLIKTRYNIDSQLSKYTAAKRLTQWRNVHIQTRYSLLNYMSRSFS